MSRRPRRERSVGQALVEFAFVFPVITLLAFGFIDVGRAVFTYNALTNAARQAARVAVVNQVDPVSAPWNCLANKPVESAVAPNWTFRGCAVAAGSTAGVRASDVSVSYYAPPGAGVTSAPTVKVDCIAAITVVTSFTPITPIAGSIIGPMTFTARSEMPVERVFP